MARLGIAASNLSGVPFNGIKSKAISPFGDISLPNLEVLPFNNANLPSGNSFLYTVPTGKKCLVFALLHNPVNVTTINAFAGISYDGGSTFFKTNGAFANALNAAPTQAAFGVVYEVGQIVSINTDQTGLNCIGAIYQFDASSPIKTVKLIAFVTGNNTLYTVPANKKAFMVFGYGVLVTGNGNSSRIFVVTTAAVTVKINLVPFGVAIGTGNQVFNLSINNTLNGAGPLWSMVQGDSININLSSGANTSHAFVTLYEQDV